MNAGASLTGFSRCENIIAVMFLNVNRFSLTISKCINLLLLSHSLSFSVPLILYSVSLALVPCSLWLIVTTMNK